MGATRLLAALSGLVALGLGLASLTADPTPVPYAVNGRAVFDTANPLTRIAIGSGADQRQIQPIWSAVRAAKPQLFIFLGDNVYGEITGKDPALPELRQAYETLGRQWTFRRLRAETPTLAVWNEHDYGPADAGAAFAYKEQSKTLFLDFWGIPADSERARRAGNYDSLIVGPVGSRVQILLLDTRSFLSPLKPADKPGAPGRTRDRPDPDPILTLIGAEQWAWLEAELAKPAELRLIVSSFQVLAEGHDHERWGNLPRERDRLMALIAKTSANGVIFLSGDRGVGAIYRQSADVPYTLFELTSGALNRPALTIVNEPGPNRLGPIYNKENFGLITIDWAHKTVRLEVKDINGRTILPASVSLETLRPSKAPAESEATGPPARIFQ